MQTRVWIDHIFEAYIKVNSQVERDTNFLLEVTRNETIIDYIIKYTDNIVILGRINQVWNYKFLLLLFELIFTIGNKCTYYTLKNNKRS